MKELLSSKELSKQTGATFRQIDYWCSFGIISPIEVANPGTGHHRRFDADLVPRLKIAVEVSNLRRTKGVDTDILKDVIQNFDRGYIQISEHVRLTWDV